MIQQQDVVLLHATIADETGNHQINFQQATGAAIFLGIRTFFPDLTAVTGNLKTFYRDCTLSNI
jgi:hypothetical protein